LKDILGIWVVKREKATQAVRVRSRFIYGSCTAQRQLIWSFDGGEVKPCRNFQREKVPCAQLTDKPIIVARNDSLLIGRQVTETGDASIDERYRLA
jgi:hypothetical protein